jgi:hypothetical protein
MILPIPYQRPHIGKAYVKRVIQALELDEEFDTPENPLEERQTGRSQEPQT